MKSTPSISVITPSFNQAKFLPECLDSVLKQTYKPIEHIVLDPGSTDGSREIAKKYAHVTLIAEPDDGQSDAICKGFNMARGDVLVWLNSDDYYPSPDVFEKVIKVFTDNVKADVVYGRANFVDEKRTFLRKGYVNEKPESLLETFEYQVGIIQPSVFIKREVFEAIGGPPTDMDFTIDYEYWVRIAKAGYVWEFLPEVLSHHRWWEQMKTAGRRGESYLEHLKTVKKHFGYAHYKWARRYAEYLVGGADGIINHSVSPSIEKDIVKKEAEILWAYNCDINAVTVLTAEDSSAGARQTLQRMHELNINFPEHLIEGNNFHAEVSCVGVRSEDETHPDSWKRMLADYKGNQGYVYHVPGEFEWMFAKDWFDQQQVNSKQRLRLLKQNRKSDICIIVGNGPSLNQVDFSIFSGQDLFISNFAYYNNELEKYASYYTVTNKLVAEQGSYEINALTIDNKFFPFWLSPYLIESENTFYLDALLRNEFSVDARDWLSWRATVSYFNMQLAYTLGYKKVLLVGFDHSYVQDPGLKEGDLINQEKNDENHFDPNYFKGKTWQAADVDNMEKMYHLAKDAFARDGREIVNCTKGGNLEVFRRGKLEDELFKVLVLSPTAIGSQCATGHLLEKLFSRFKAFSILQIYVGAEPQSEIANFYKLQNNAAAINAAQQLCTQFSPDVIYYRPVDDPLFFHEFACAVIIETDTPLITHFMDDCMGRMSYKHPGLYAGFKQTIQGLIDRSETCLSICDDMSITFKQRYGKNFTAFSNCVNEGDWPLLETNNGDEIVIRYCGGLADDMTFQSIKEVTEVIGDLSGSYPVKFEIYTMPWYLEKSKELEICSAISVLPIVDDYQYPNLLSSADILLIAYNFDEVSKGYVQLSMANKLPECLASGVPVFAYGPDQVATIKYIKQHELGLVVDERDKVKLANAFITLLQDQSRRKEFGIKGRKFVFAKHNQKEIVSSFYKLMIKAAGSGFKISSDQLQPASKPTLAATEAQDSWLQTFWNKVVGRRIAGLFRPDRTWKFVNETVEFYRTLLGVITLLVAAFVIFDGVDVITNTIGKVLGSNSIVNGLGVFLKISELIIVLLLISWIYRWSIEKSVSQMNDRMEKRFKIFERKVEDKMRTEITRISEEKKF